MENKKNTAASTPEMVTISRAEYDSQQAQLTELKLQNQWLLEQLGLAKKRQFGASSERLQEGLMDQLSLMANEAEAYAYGTKNATAEQVAVKAEWQCTGYCAGGHPYGSGGAPPLRGRAYLRYLRRRDGGDWERGAPEPEDGAGPILDPGGCVLHLRM